MSLPTAKQHVYQAKHFATNDTARPKHLTDAVYTLIQVVEEQEDTIRRIKSNDRKQS